MDVVAAVLGVTAPGFAVTLAVFGLRDVPAWRLAASTVAFGYTVWALAAFVLALAGVLSASGASVVAGVATPVAIVVAVRRGHLALSWGDEGRRLLLPALGLLVAITAAVVSHAFVPQAYNLTQAAPVRYWADAAQIAEAGRIPAAVVHWGALQPPTISKVLANCFNAVGVGVFGSGLDGLASARMLALVLFTISLWSALRAIGLHVLAAPATVLLLCTPALFGGELTTDLAVYKTETIGRAVAFAALALAIDAIRRSSAGTAAAAGGVFGVAAVTHLSATVGAALLLGAYGVVHVARTTTLLRVARLALVMVVPAAVMTASVIVAAPGDPGFQGIVSADSESLSDGFDATQYYVRLSMDAAMVVNDSAWIAPPRVILGTLLEKGVPWGSTPTRVLMFGAVVLLAIVTALRAPSQLRHIPVVALAYCVALVLLAFSFALRYDTFIPGVTGVRRGADYGPLVVMLVLSAAAEAALTRRPRWGDRAPTSAVALGVTVVLAIAVGVSSSPVPTAAPFTPDAAAPMGWLRANTSCSDRVLANYRTAGSFELLAGRVAVTEGMAPYLRPSVLPTTTQLLIDAQRFFEAPARHERFLRRQGVDVVYVSHSPHIGTNAKLGDGERLTNVAFLSEVHATDEATIYRVTDAATDALPHARGRPGYGC